MTQLFPFSTNADTLCSVASTVSSFIDMADVYRVRRVCASCRKHYGSRSCTKAALTYGGGVPNALHHKFWHFCLKVDDAKAQLYPIGYDSLEHGGGISVLDHIGAEGEIRRDVGRTFPSIAIFMKKSGIGQNLLSNILNACTTVFTDVAYCQGMNYVAAVFLLARLQAHNCWNEVQRKDSIHSDTSSEDGYLSFDGDRHWLSTPIQHRVEEDVFWLMGALVSKPRGRSPGCSKLVMNGIWLPGCPELKLRVFQFQTLMERELPKLVYHFRHIGLHLEIIISQWFLTLFAYSFPMDALFHIWDSILMDGWKALFRIGLAQLKSVEDTMLNLELEEMSVFLRSFRDDTLFMGENFAQQAKALLRESYKIKVTRSCLENMQIEFAVLLIREHFKLNNTEGGNWLLRYGSPEDGLSRQYTFGIEAIVRMILLDEKLVRGLRSEVDRVSSEMTSDCSSYQARIEDCEEVHGKALKTVDVLDKRVEEQKIDLEELFERIHLLINQMHGVLDKSPVYCTKNEKNGLRHSSESAKKEKQLLSKDLRGFYNKINEVQIDALELGNLLAMNTSKLHYAKIEVDEVLERKRALCSQMAQLLMEQNRKIDLHIQAFAEVNVRCGLCNRLLTADYKNEAVLCRRIFKVPHDCFYCLYSPYFCAVIATTPLELELTGK